MSASVIKLPPLPPEPPFLASAVHSPRLPASCTHTGFERPWAMGSVRHQPCPGLTLTTMPRKLVAKRGRTGGGKRRTRGDRVKQNVIESPTEPDSNISFAVHPAPTPVPVVSADHLSPRSREKLRQRAPVGVAPDFLGLRADLLDPFPPCTPRVRPSAPLLHLSVCLSLRHLSVSIKAPVIANRSLIQTDT